MTGDEATTDAIEQPVLDSAEVAEVEVPAGPDAIEVPELEDAPEAIELPDPSTSADDTEQATPMAWVVPDIEYTCAEEPTTPAEVAECMVIEDPTIEVDTGDIMELPRHECWPFGCAPDYDIAPWPTDDTAVEAGGEHLVEVPAPGSSDGLAATGGDPLAAAGLAVALLAVGLVALAAAKVSRRKRLT